MFNFLGWGIFGGLNMEFDLFVGYVFLFVGGKFDVGLIWYMYLGGVDKIDFVEFYVKFSGDVGFVNLFVGVVYVLK